ncbi:MAG: tetratricopeptide repeat protein [Geminocystis sp.]|nr:tetratricopeptide repeat protein [Geminocystis sp.]MCS7149083.1 tetratricopeptide repeat protein [Geminocystis sp.]MCX8079579.1 tetratricopeptide repeat protein [Geminocystis sp.]MDW8114861.1 tetratricopeptide repeat protein [Geminocystis sp.]MDW8464128.1 tetratricopeptide repeat protein [Geminocystis sp.]
MVNIRRWLKLIPATISPMEDEEAEDDSLSSADGVAVKDKDLEFLFYQLLEGVAKGWGEAKVEQFFQRLQPKISVENWLDWLQRYRWQLLASPNSHIQTAARMIVLGEITATLPFFRAVGDLAYEIGKELLNRSQNSATVNATKLQNYNSPPQNQQNTHSPQQNSKQNPPPAEKPVPLGQFLSLLQQDEEFAREVAKQLKIDSADPGIILDRFLEKQNQQGKFDSLPPQVSQELVEYLFNLGLTRAQEGNFEEALAYWDQALSLNPKHAPSWHNRGSALAYLNRLPEAVESFDKAIALDVNDHISWYDRGNALFRIGNYQEAINSWERVIGIQPNHYEAWYHRGIALEKLHRYDEALDSYQKCLKIHPDFSPAIRRLEKLESKKKEHLTDLP